MAKNKNNTKEAADEIKEDVTPQAEEETAEEAVTEEEIEVEVSPELKKLSEKCDEIQDKYMRLAAEYDNFRKRSAKEKEMTYSDAFAHAVSGILPIIDNIERAAQFATDESEMSKGVLMLKKQCFDALEKMGVKAMESDGAEFNPELHNAVMHEEDDSENKNIVSETFQKGYMYGDKVIRHAMVKVLN
jgi:molecular chaperone GrpE